MTVFASMDGSPTSPIAAAAFVALFVAVHALAFFLAYRARGDE